MFGLTDNVRSRNEKNQPLSRDSSQKSPTLPAIPPVDSGSTGDNFVLKGQNPPKSSSQLDQTPQPKRKKHSPKKRGSTKSYSIELKEPPESLLIRRAEAHDPSVSMISMDSSQQMDISPGQEHTSFTHGLGGCSAAFLLSKAPDGTQKSTFGHFSPFGFPQRKKSFENKIRQHRSLSDHQLLMILPGERKSTADGSTEIVPMPQALDIPLRSSVQSQLKGKLPQKTIPYNLLRQPGASNAFIIHHPKNPSEALRYEVCGEKSGELN